jgi:hypothetical protein
LTPGNLELLQVIVEWTVTLPAVTIIIVHDERRLRGEALARAWPPSSRDAAIFGLWNLGVHHLCVLVHFARTRRSLRGVGMGILGVAVVVALGLCAELGTTALVDWLAL